jgi:hypothetical protein
MKVLSLLFALGFIQSHAHAISFGSRIGNSESKSLMKAKYKTTGTKAYILSGKIKGKNQDSAQIFYGCIPGDEQSIAMINLDFTNILVQKTLAYLQKGISLGITNPKINEFESFEECTIYQTQITTDVGNIFLGESYYQIKYNEVVKLNFDTKIEAPKFTSEPILQVYTGKRTIEKYLDDNAKDCSKCDAEVKEKFDGLRITLPAIKDSDLIKASKLLASKEIDKEDYVDLSLTNASQAEIIKVLKLGQKINYKDYFMLRERNYFESDAIEVSAASFEDKINVEDYLRLRTEGAFHSDAIETGKAAKAGKFLLNDYRTLKKIGAFHSDAYVALSSNIEASDYIELRKQGVFHSEALEASKQMKIGAFTKEDYIKLKKKGLFHSDIIKVLKD